MALQTCPICGPQEYRQAPNGQAATFCISCNRTRDKAQEWADQFHVGKPLKPLNVKEGGILSALLSRVGISRDPVVAHLLQIAEAIRDDLKSSLLLSADSAIDEFVMGVKKWPQKLVDDYKAEVRKGLKAEYCVYNYVIRKAANRLTSGELHIFPGVLGNEGMWLYDFFLKAVSNMVAMGAYTQEWATESWRRPVAEGIREGG